MSAVLVPWPTPEGPLPCLPAPFSCTLDCMTENMSFWPQVGHGHPLHDQHQQDHGWVVLPVTT